MSDGQNKALAGLIVVAVLSGGYVWVSGRSDEGVSCYATSAAVGIVAEGLRSKQSAGAIVAAAGAGFLASKCEKWVETLVEDPDQQTELVVESAEQASTDTTVTGGELAAPPPPRPSTDDVNASLQRISDCARWQTTILRQWCWDGRIDPPVANYSPQRGL